jgi:hypothetical protein
MFLTTALDTLVRLSYHDRVQKCLPESMWCLLSPADSNTITKPYAIADSDEVSSAWYTMYFAIALLCASRAWELSVNCCI